MPFFERALRAKMLAFIASLLVANQCWASNTEGSYLERCLRGLVGATQCERVIVNFWKHDAEMQMAAQASGLEAALVRAVVAVESRFNARAKSPVGATGVMQIMPGTGRDLGVHDASRLYDPRTNLLAGTRYLVQMYDTFGNWPLAIAAYNAGPGAVRKFGNRIPPYRETQDYVKQVLHFYRLFKLAEAKPTLDHYNE